MATPKLKVEMSLDEIMGHGGSKRKRGFRADEVNVAFNESDDVGRLIGEKGATIKRICSESGSFITFSKDNAVGAIRGTKDAIIKALGLISTELGKPGGRSISLNVIVPRGEVGKIIGSKGATVKRLEEESGAKISILAATGGQQQVQISGIPDAVHAVAEYVVTCTDFAALSSQKTDTFDSNGFPNKRPRPSTSAMINCTISFEDASEVSKIIGKGGLTIKKISKDSGTFITFARNNGSGTIKGTKPNVILAIQLIITELKTLSKKVVSIIVFVPKDEVAKIIGKRGATIKKIESESGAAISISGGPVQPVKFTGTVEEVSAAVEQCFKYVDYFSLESDENTSDKSNDDKFGGSFQRNGRGSYRKNDTMNETELTIKVIVEGDKVCGVIGRGGCGIKHIARSSGVTISFTKEKVYVTGTEIAMVKGKTSSVVRAAQLIFERLETLGLESGARANSLTLVIPSSTVGWIVGKGGMTIKKTSEDSNAKFSIEREKVTVSGIEENLITVEGSSSSVQAGLKLLLEQLAACPEKRQ